MTEGHWLGGLQVGETGHDGVGFGFGQTEQTLLQAGDFCQDQVDLVAQPQADVGGHLVVAATAGVQFFAGNADAVGQTRLDVHVHVFQVDAPVELAGLDLALDLLEAGFDGVALIHSQDADLGQHGGVGDGAKDVVAIQALVEFNGGGKARHKGVDGLAEAAAPGLVGFFAAHEGLSAGAEKRAGHRWQPARQSKCGNNNRVGG